MKTETKPDKKTVTTTGVRYVRINGRTLLVTAHIMARGHLAVIEYGSTVRKVSPKALFKTRRDADFGGSIRWRAGWTTAYQNKVTPVWCSVGAHGEIVYDDDANAKRRHSRFADQKVYRTEIGAWRAIERTLTADAKESDRETQKQIKARLVVRMQMAKALSKLKRKK